MCECICTRVHACVCVCHFRKVLILFQVFYVVEYYTGRPKVSDSKYYSKKIFDKSSLIVISKFLFQAIIFEIIREVSVNIVGYRPHLDGHLSVESR